MYLQNTITLRYAADSIHIFEFAKNLHCKSSRDLVGSLVQYVSSHIHEEVFAVNISSTLSYPILISGYTPVHAP